MIDAADFATDVAGDAALGNMVDIGNSKRKSEN